MTRGAVLTVIAAVSLAPCPAAAQARPYWVINNSETSGTYMDRSLVRSGGTVKGYYTTVYLKGADEYRQGVGADMLRTEWDCGASRYRFLGMVQYATDYTTAITAFDTDDDRWSTPFPGTLAEAMMDLACKGARADIKSVSADSIGNLALRALAATIPLP